MREAVVLMAKAPFAGRVKTRLAPPLDSRESARLYACMLEDTAAELSAMPRVRRYLFFDPPESGDYFRSPPFAAFKPLPQRGRDLGERMRNASGIAFLQGAHRVVIVGADCPSLSAGTVRRAFAELSSGASAVFGPSLDGGYYLVGLSTPDERLFRGIRWSTPEVLRETAARCRLIPAPFSFLPPGRDVDTGQDLLPLRDWARTHARPACPLTRGWITAYFGSGRGKPRRRRGRTPGPRRGSRSRREG